MKATCSYCRKCMPDKEPFYNDKVSHTICPECFDYFMEQQNGLVLENYLDNFESPVMIVDADCQIVAANNKSARLTGKPRHEVVGLLGGEAVWGAVIPVCLEDVEKPYTVKHALFAKQ